VDWSLWFLRKKPVLFVLTIFKCQSCQKNCFCAIFFIFCSKQVKNYYT
jgi:hypothetical protein